MSVSLRNTTLFADASLTHYWELENLTDSKGASTLTNTTGKSFVAAKFNNGIDMGSSIRNTTELSVASNIIPAYNAAFTISLWFKQNIVLDATNSTPGLIICSTGAATGYAISLQPQWNAGSPRLVVLRRTSSDATDVVSFANDLNWHHFVSVYDGTKIVSYLDGVAFGSGIASSSNFNATGYPYLSIGGSYMSSNATAIIDDVAFFSRALSAAEVNIIFNAVQTNAVSNIATTTAVGNGEVLSDGGVTITERGFVWATTTAPTTSNGKVTASGTIGTYTASLTGLSINTLYYVRSYYINASGTTYGNEVTFTTLNINQYQLQYPGINAVDGETFVGQINVTGTLGTITVQLGTTGTSTVISAGAGATTFSGTYSGLSGLIITRSATFNGTIDDVYYARVPLGTTINWALNTIAITTSIPSEVFFKRVEDQIFNNFRFYRYLDLLFKDLDGYVTVTVRQEREDNTIEKSKTFVVGNPASGTVSPFQKKRISFLCKDQAIIIGLSNANLNETFSIAQYLLIGDKKPRRTISPTKVISIG